MSAGEILLRLKQGNALARQRESESFRDLGAFAFGGLKESLDERMKEQQRKRQQADMIERIRESAKQQMMLQRQHARLQKDVAGYKETLEKQSMGFRMSEWDRKLLKYGGRFRAEMMDLSVNIPLERALDLGRGMVRKILVE